MASFTSIFGKMGPMIDPAPLFVWVLRMTLKAFQPEMLPSDRIASIRIMIEAQDRFPFLFRMTDLALAQISDQRRTLIPKPMVVLVAFITFST